MWPLCKNVATSKILFKWLKRLKMAKKCQNMSKKGLKKLSQKNLSTLLHDCHVFQLALKFFWIFLIPATSPCTIIQSLESRRIQQLYNDKAEGYDPINEMKSLNMSITLKFLDLLELLQRNPGEEHREKIHQDLELLFVNIHHLVNEYRPHQARETLIVLMEIQKKSREETTEKLSNLINAVKNLVNASILDLKDIKISNLTPTLDKSSTDGNNTKLEDIEAEANTIIDQMHDELMNSLLADHL